MHGEFRGDCKGVQADAFLGACVSPYGNVETELFIKRFRLIRSFQREEAAHRLLGTRANLCRIASPLLVDQTHMAIAYPVAVADLVRVINNNGGGLGEGPLGALLAADLATAVAFCHERGIAHRDIKPDNVLLSRSGEFMLTDFGHAVDASTTDLVLRGGTPQYEPPECLVKGRVRTAVRMDMFCMGKTLVVGMTWSSASGCLALGEGPLQDMVRACLAENPMDRPLAVEFLDVANAAARWSDGCVQRGRIVERSMLRL